jgi:lysophospholipase
MLHLVLSSFAILAGFAGQPGQVAAQQSLSPAAVAYAPQKATCPPSLVRSAGPGHATISSQEADYISARRQQVLPESWSTYLSNVEATASAAHVSLPDYVSRILHNRDTFPTLGVATSGGGYRAAMFGGGVLNALDGRNATAAKAGTGGLLQSASYLAGLSGGGWLVTSLVQANFPTLPNLAFGLDFSPNTPNSFGGWLPQHGILDGFNDTTTLNEYLGILLNETAGKFAAGFPVTVTDPYARGISRHFANGTTLANFLDTNVTHGAGLLWSEVRNL